MSQRTGTPPAVGNRKPSRLGRLGRAQNIPYLLLGIALLLFPILDSNRSQIDVAAFAGVWVLLALGLNIVVGYAGLLDLGYAAFFAIGSYAFALLASGPFNTWHLLRSKLNISCAPRQFCHTRPFVPMATPPEPGSGILSGGGT